MHDFKSRALTTAMIVASGVNDGEGQRIVSSVILKKYSLIHNL